MPDGPIKFTIRRTGDPQPYNEGNKGSIHPDYKAILDTDRRLQGTFRFHSEVLPGLLKAGKGPQIEKVLAAYLRQGSELTQSTSLPPIKWVSDDPVVRNITGTDLTFPVMEFNLQQLPVLEFMTTEGTLGVTYPVPVEYMSLGEMGGDDAYPVRGILLTDNSVRSPIPYEERRSHEFAHGVDPKAFIRIDDALVLDEIVAIVGSCADSDIAKVSGVTLNPPFIVPYVIDQARLLGIELSETELLQQVALVCHLVDRSTHLRENGRKIPNDAVARRLMAADDLKDLYKRWPELFNFTRVQ